MYEIPIGKTQVEAIKLLMKIHFDNFEDESMYQVLDS